ncbi:hypothetical protein WJX84_011838 [Apatococcus fuscideae]|uniref:5-formyltetrahydrofolate cyclo-ligase n=1 Tax=Apatococcus fuscideae TaxID=2026836 RepID=A0AAW1SUQ5_9CHLO
MRAASTQQVAAEDALGGEKAKTRRHLKRALKETSLEALQQESKQIAARILEADTFGRSRRLGIYIHCAQLREVDTGLILKAALAKEPACKCFVPVVEDRNSNMRMVHLDDMDGLEAVPPFNILEPKPLYTGSQQPREDVLEADPPLDLLIMPGLGFDESGRRLGRGGGYYDKFVSRCISHAEQLQRPAPLLVACAFRSQLVDCIPTGEDDRDMDVIVTADRIFRCSERGREWS